MSSYKVKVKSPDLEMRHKPVCIEVSLSNKNTTGSKFAATLKWADKHFSHGMIVLGDTLNRHNYKLWTGGDLNKAYLMSKDAGDQWIRDNEEILARYANKFQLLRWDCWLSLQSFENNLKKTRKLLKDDSGFREAVYNDASNFLKRNTEVVQEFGEEKVLSCSTEYILEEVAIDSLYCQKYAPARVYPAAFLHSEVYFIGKQKFPEPFESFKKSPLVTIRFEKYKSSDMKTVESSSAINQRRAS